jgi:beta-glucanase (GH16 family)
MFIAIAFLLVSLFHAQEYKLVWSDEFNTDGRPASHWSYESGYVRNNEAQYYTNSTDNAYVKNGSLHITARRNNQGHDYTSSSLHTRNSFTFTYGRVEVRAKIPTAGGAWPAIWTLGNWWDWPSCGEVDIFEYYNNGILANAAWGSSTAWKAVWDSSKTALTHWTNSDKDWLNKFHVWREDWDYNHIRLYLDDELLNEIDLSKTFNQMSDNKNNPFREHDGGFGDYIIVNLALGGNNGGTIDDSAFPMEFVIDYVRVYQK